LKGGVNIFSSVSRVQYNQVMSLNYLLVVRNWETKLPDYFCEVKVFYIPVVLQCSLL